MAFAAMHVRFLAPDAPVPWFDLALVPLRMWEDLRAGCLLAGMTAHGAAQSLRSRLARGRVARYLQPMAADTAAVTLVEYALIGGLVSIALAFILPDLRASLDQLYLRTASGLGAAAASAQTP